MPDEEELRVDLACRRSLRDYKVRSAPEIPSAEVDRFACYVVEDGSLDEHIINPIAAKNATANNSLAQTQ